jgi:uncharacterized FlgJ-related protein
MTTRQQKKKHEVLKKRLEFLELQDDIKMYKEYLNMDWQERDSLKKAWDEYYVLVTRSSAYKNYQKARSAFSERKFNLMKKFVEMNKKIHEERNWTVPKPYLCDPESFNSGQVAEYRRLLIWIENLEKEGGFLDY